MPEVVFQMVAFGLEGIVIALRVKVRTVRE